LERKRASQETIFPTNYIVDLIPKAVSEPFYASEVAKLWSFQQKTLGECIDTPNALAKELKNPKYRGHHVWIRDAFGDRRYHGVVG